LFKKYDIKTMGFFMMGLTGDNKRTTEDTIDFAIKLNPHFASFAITTPFPGTEMFEEYIKKGWMPKDLNFHNLELHSSDLTRTDSLNPREVIEYYNKAQRKFYLRLGYWASLFLYFAKHPEEMAKYGSRLQTRLRLKK
jgi:anaerobic magnesium-protoporphyrin IX monomethyl ester cyclase